VEIASDIQNAVSTGLITASNKIGQMFKRLVTAENVEPRSTFFASEGSENGYGDENSVPRN